MKHFAIAIMVAGCGCGSSHDDRATPEAMPGSAATVRAAGSAVPAEPFWAYVVAHAPALAAEPLEAAMDELQAQLSPAHPGVLVELAADGAHRTLVLTADGDRALFPAIQALYASRPTVPGWDLVAFRPRDHDRPLAVISIGDRTLDPNAVRYVAERTDDKVDVVVFEPGYTAKDVKTSQLAYIALDHVVGEYDVETRIGAISLAPLAAAPKTAHTLPELPTELDALLATAPDTVAGPRRTTR